jgi:CheY-like chemotaxis protein
MQEADLSADDSRVASIRHLIRREIPFLRRHGRALIGEQRLADLSVVQLMDDLLTEPNAISANSKVALYRRLLHNLENVLQSPEGSPCQALPTPRCRQAHLLTNVEGFSRSQAAEILGVTSGELDSLLQDACNEIARQARARVLIIEDERFIMLHLESLVHELGHEVVGSAETLKIAVAEARRTAPDLILSDVHLADGSSGRDAVQEILNEQGEIPVIFITAYPERLLTGRGLEPAFLISKPFHDESVKATISQACFLHQLKESARSSHQE